MTCAVCQSVCPPKKGKQKDTKESRLFGWPSHWSDSRRVAMTACWVSTGTQTDTICHFVAVKVKRLTQQQTVTNNFCKATSNQPVLMRKTWTAPQQITATYFNKFSHIVLDYQWIKCKSDNSTAFADHVVKMPDIHTNCLWCWDPHQSHNWLDLRQRNKENYNVSLTS